MLGLAGRRIFRMGLTPFSRVRSPLISSRDFRSLSCRVMPEVPLSLSEAGTRRQLCQKQQGLVQRSQRNPWGRTTWPAPRTDWSWPATWWLPLWRRWSRGWPWCLRASSCLGWLSDCSKAQAFLPRMWTKPQGPPCALRPPWRGPRRLASHWCKHHCFLPKTNCFSARALYSFWFLAKIANFWSRKAFLLACHIWPTSAAVMCCPRAELCLLCGTPAPSKEVDAAWGKSKWLLHWSMQHLEGFLKLSRRCWWNCKFCTWSRSFNRTRGRRSRRSFSYLPCFKVGGV